ncbi:MAG TPA: PQQ-binding-like beta-propeller repeat protein, partial [Planctomycetia bacterium]|nr:PQQ-binding-like beta-propeller repeat protein [Planctomycetia bacterium]
LPDSFPAKPAFAWSKSLSGRALAGVAATSKYVLVADREADDTVDAFFCLDAATGAEKWAIRYKTAGSLDYGNSPRATPLVVGDKVYLYGAFGHLHCVRLSDGELLWKKNLRRAFDVKEPSVWGFCSTPLLADGKLIVNPGAPDASIVALDPENGEVLWKTAGGPAAFASFILAELGGVRQLVGYDAASAGGWDPATGRRLWTLKPQKPKDFNVPTPLVWKDKLLLASENNGLRAHGFKAGGVIDPAPAATFAPLAPDSHTPVIVGDRLFGIWHSMFCVDLAKGLSQVWENEDSAFSGYGALIASSDKVLALNQEGELLLFAADSADGKPLARLRLFENERGVLAHPALVGRRLYVRNSSGIHALDL